MNMLSAIVVNEWLGGKLVYVPKPKSICMALSVAVGCVTFSSSILRILGLKDVRELQSRGLDIFGDIGAVFEEIMELVGEYTE